MKGMVCSDGFSGATAMGVQGKGVPIAIDFMQVMKCDGGRAFDLEITEKGPDSGPCDQGTEQGKEEEIASYSDDTLREKIGTYNRHFRSLAHTIKDKGENIRKHLEMLYKEQKKRQQQDKEDFKTGSGLGGNRKSTPACKATTTKQTGYQANGYENNRAGAFDSELAVFNGTWHNDDLEIKMTKKSVLQNDLLGDTKGQSNNRNSDSYKMLSVSSFYPSFGHGAGSHEGQKKAENGKHRNEERNSFGSMVSVSGKRNRTTSLCKHNQKHANASRGFSLAISNRQAKKAATNESVSGQNSWLLPRTHRHMDSMGASLDTAMELSDDEEKGGLEYARDDFQFGKNSLVHGYGLRSNSGRKEGFRIAYPRGDPEAVEVQQSDLKHLNASEFLNDTVIDFYIKYIQRPENFSNEKKARFHFFNTFFFKKLLLEKRKKKSDDYFSKLRKWTKGIDIFEKKYLLVPVHDSAHWSLAIVCFSMEQEDKEWLKPYILHLDSMREGHVSEEVFQILKRYLKAEWLHTRGIDGSSGSYKVVLTDCSWKRVEVPQQQNAWDCGLFLLFFMECFVRDAPLEFKPSSLDSMFGRDWFRPQEASNLRPFIKRLLESLVESANVEILMEDMD